MFYFTCMLTPLHHKQTLLDNTLLLGIAGLIMQAALPAMSELY